jgi:ubiquinone/menaquinone biosynthesis C-methylase UbiE
MSTEYFDRVAPDWDRMRSSFFSDAVRKRAYFEADLQPGKIAADIGAGTGFISEGLIKRGLNVIAVDRSEAMLEEMRRKLKREDIDYRLAKLDRLPIQDSSADYAFANMYLHHVESPFQAIKEMARILRPGGKLVITDLDKHSFEFLKEEHHDVWMGFDREDISEWLAAAGLKDVRVLCVGENCSARSGCSGDQASISIFLASGVK